MYAKFTWEQKVDYPESHFATKDTLQERTQIHASIIQFKGVGMILDKKSWKKFQVWRKEHLLIPGAKKAEIDWSDL
jgi:hypothetical protein